MNKSREYLKGLPVNERKVLAAKVDVTQDFLYQIGAGIRNPSRELALRLEPLTNRKVKESDFDREIKVFLDSIST